jgi:hypothetical protein
VNQTKHHDEGPGAHKASKDESQFSRVTANEANNTTETGITVRTNTSGQADTIGIGVEQAKSAAEKVNKARKQQAANQQAGSNNRGHAETGGMEKAVTVEADAVGAH